MGNADRLRGRLALHERSVVVDRKRSAAAGRPFAVVRGGHVMPLSRRHRRRKREIDVVVARAASEMGEREFLVAVDEAELDGLCGLVGLAPPEEGAVVRAVGVALHPGGARVGGVAHGEAGVSRVGAADRIAVGAVRRVDDGAAFGIDDRLRRRVRPHVERVHALGAAPQVVGILELPQRGEVARGAQGEGAGRDLGAARIIRRAAGDEVEVRTVLAEGAATVEPRPDDHLRGRSGRAAVDRERGAVLEADAAERSVARQIVQGLVAGKAECAVAGRLEREVGGKRIGRIGMARVEVGDLRRAQRAPHDQEVVHEADKRFGRLAPRIADLEVIPSDLRRPVRRPVSRVHQGPVNVVAQLGVAVVGDHDVMPGPVLDVAPVGLVARRAVPVSVRMVESPGIVRLKEVALVPRDGSPMADGISVSRALNRRLHPEGDRVGIVGDGDAGERVPVAAIEIAGSVEGEHVAAFGVGHDLRVARGDKRVAAEAAVVDRVAGVLEAPEADAVAQRGRERADLEISVVCLDLGRLGQGTEHERVLSARDIGAVRARHGKHGIGDVSADMHLASAQVFWLLVHGGREEASEEVCLDGVGHGQAAHALVLAEGHVPQCVVVRDTHLAFVNAEIANVLLGVCKGVLKDQRARSFFPDCMVYPGVCFPVEGEFALVHAERNRPGTERPHVVGRKAPGERARCFWRRREPETGKGYRR